MLFLNLLSNEYKQKLHQIKMQLLLKQLLVVIILVTLAISITISVTEKIVTNNIERFNTTSTAAQQNINTKINNINSLVLLAKKIQKEHTNWATLMVDISEKIPRAINVTSIKIDKNNKIFTIIGLANTREDLLLLKDNLEKLPELSDIELPIQSIAQKTNINFNISTSLIIENLQ